MLLRFAVSVAVAGVVEGGRCGMWVVWVVWGGPDDSQHDESILVCAEVHLIKDATEQLQG